MKLAFGKIDLTKPRPLRSFETYFGIDPSQVTGSWRSASPSVQRLLDHLARFSKSESSKESYLNQLRRFCIRTGFMPDECVQLSKQEIETFIQRYVDELAQKKASRSYLNTIIKRLETFFKLQGFTGQNKLNLQKYYVPTRYRSRKEYIPLKSDIYAMAEATDNTRNRAIILTLFSSGLRVSTFSALNVSDLKEELDENEQHIKIAVYPGMKERVSNACKGHVPYYTFICLEATQAIRVYLREREEVFGEIDPDEPLFSSKWNLWKREHRIKRRFGRRGISLILKKAARLTGITQWQHITPHSLRKSFESVLRSPTRSGRRMDKSTQEFLMGHILPQSQDTYYDKNDVDFHRKEYSDLDFSRDFQRVIHSDKLIDMRELEGYLFEGWMFVSKISEEKAVVRRKN